ncbi:PREDICTED: protein AF1q-like [Calidris pugnax]|uniref:protein AF1q-like n=1 Tax=Calidris pugnax TaxID=198806 RepID=UPI00071E33AF|nr:PREDICTED: protein AF1q-like [Calidris pugnax]
MLDTISSQYDSFIYWRMPIPRLDVAELEGLGLADVALYKPKGGLGKLTGQRDRASQDISEDEDSLLQFNSFNFWRAPIASISALDFDLIFWFPTQLINPFKNNNNKKNAAFTQVEALHFPRGRFSPALSVG